MTLSKMELLKKSSCPEEIAAPKSNCCVEIVTLRKYEEVASPVAKYARGDIAIWKKKKKNPKLNQWYRLIEIIFPERFPYPNKYSWRISIPAS